MITLDATTKKIQIALAASKTTNDCPFVTAYTDNSVSAFTPGSADGISNGISTVTIMDAPATSAQRQLKYFSFYNADTVATTISILYNDNSTTRIILRVVLTAGYTLTYNLDSGWTVTDTNGSIQYVGNTGATGPAGADGKPDKFYTFYNY